MALCLGAGAIGSLFTTPAINTWYVTLNKPSFNPPNYIFAPVWTILYILMGLSFYLILVSKEREKQTAVMFFVLQLILNVLWSLVFFGLHSPLGALITIVLLWISILMTIINFYKISKPASYLLIPYILWVSFASVLNLSIGMLN
ncbi:MAG: TspO/MBR family protein [Patescibacteria group bacterium]